MWSVGTGSIRACVNLLSLPLEFFKPSKKATEKMHIESHDDCRRYAGLYFCICVDVSDNNLYYLEVRPANYNSLQLWPSSQPQAIHNFVEVLNEYFHNVCELDLVFNFYKVGRLAPDLRDDIPAQL